MLHKTVDELEERLTREEFAGWIAWRELHAQERGR